MRQHPQKIFRFSKDTVKHAVCHRTDCRFLVTLRYDAMADIYKLFLAFGDLKQQYSELDLRAVRPLIMVLKVLFWK